MGKLKSLANLLFVPGSLTRTLKEIENEAPPKSEAEKQLSVYSWASVTGLEICRIGAYIATTTLPLIHYFSQKS